MPRVQPKQLPKGVRAITKDRFGRRVRLTNDRWRHILKGHPGMEGLELALMRAIENVDEHRDSHRGNGVELLFGRNLGPAKWLVAVVAYDADGAGNVLTAYPQRADPPSETPERTPR